MGRTRHGRQTTYENNVRETSGKQRTLKSPEGLELQKNLKVGIVHFPASTNTQRRDSSVAAIPSLHILHLLLLEEAEVDASIVAVLHEARMRGEVIVGTMFQDK